MTHWGSALWAVCLDGSCEHVDAGVRETSPRVVANPSPTVSRVRQLQQLAPEEAEQPDDTEVATPEAVAASEDKARNNARDKAREDPGAEPTDAAVSSAAATTTAAFAQESAAAASTAAATLAAATDNEAPTGGAREASGAGIASKDTDASQAAALSSGDPTDNASTKVASHPEADGGVNKEASRLGADTVPSKAGVGGDGDAPPQVSHAQPSQPVRKRFCPSCMVAFRFNTTSPSAVALQPHS